MKEAVAEACTLVFVPYFCNIWSEQSDQYRRLNLDCGNSHDLANLWRLSLQQDQATTTIILIIS